MIGYKSEFSSFVIFVIINEVRVIYILHLGYCADMCVWQTSAWASLAMSLLCCSVSATVEVSNDYLIIPFIAWLVFCGVVSLY